MNSILRCEFSHNFLFLIFNYTFHYNIWESVKANESRWIREIIMLINIHCAKYIVIGAVPMIFLYLYLKLKYYE